MFTIYQYIGKLQQKNERSYFLAVLRVLSGLWFMKEMIFRWKAFGIFFGPGRFADLDTSFTLERYGINVNFLKEHYIILVSLIMILLLLNILGIGKNIISLFLFITVIILFHLNNKYTNGGDLMYMLLLLYLSFANSYDHFTLIKRKPFAEEKEKVYNLASNLAAYSIMINLCLCYFLAGAFKASDPYWQKGTGIYYFANDDRFSVFAAGGRQVNMPFWLSLIIGYGTIILEMGFPFLVWNKRSRNITLLLCFLMHAGAFFFLMIYDMSLIFVIQYGIFYSNEEVTAFAGKIKRYFRKLFRFA